MDKQQSSEWSSLRKSLIKVNGLSINKPNCLLVEADARVALPNLPQSSVSCIITSPPYAARKDYKTSNQIGFGQDCDSEYLPDLKNILLQLFRIAKPGAALWIVLDTVKQAGETVSLPWEVVTRAREAGWTFHDLVIWDKGKNLPWSNPGRFRGVCEYILLLGKGKLANFNLNAVRDSDHLSSYWVKYPERYHPDGKAPSDLWHFPIPNQGSWSKGQSRHDCPFPIGLVARMISITTKAGDVILDPFSGTGSVIATASHMSRHGIGFEINKDFVQEFKDNGYKALIERAKMELPQSNSNKTPLRKAIIDLRMLKYPRTLFADISRSDRLNGTARQSIGAFFIPSAVHTEPNNAASLDSSDLGRLELQVLLRPDSDKERVEKAVQERMAAKPLSIFGLKANVKVIPFTQWSHELSVSTTNEDPWYIYRNGRFYKYDDKITAENLLNTIRAESADTLRKVPSIIANLKINLDKPVSD
jgi:DNA modification methylase